MLLNPDIPTGGGWLGFRLCHPSPDSPLDGIVVREALSHSLDRDTTIQVVWRGDAEPMTLLPTQMAGYYDGGKDDVHHLKLAADLFDKLATPKGLTAS